MDIEVYPNYEVRVQVIDHTGREERKLSGTLACERPEHIVFALDWLKDEVIRMGGYKS